MNLEEYSDWFKNRRKNRFNAEVFVLFRKEELKERHFVQLEDENNFSYKAIEIFTLKRLALVYEQHGELAVYIPEYFDIRRMTDKDKLELELLKLSK